MIDKKKMDGLTSPSVCMIHMIYMMVDDGHYHLPIHLTIHRPTIIGPPLLPAGYAEMETLGKLLKVRK